QADTGQRRYFLGAHSLAEVKPENRAVSLLVGTDQATPQVAVDFLEKDSEIDLPLAAMRFIARFRLNITNRKMLCAAARRLAMAASEIVMSGVGGNFFQIPENRFRTLDCEIPQQLFAAFPKFHIGSLNQVLDHRP